MSHVETLIELARISNEMPPRYLPLADDIACPICKSILYDEISALEKDVREMKCQECSARFYFDYWNFNI